MKVIQVAQNTKLITLSRGEDVFSKLSEFCEETGLQNASFTGIGAIEGLSCGYYDLEKREYFFTQYEGIFEAVSLSGNIILKERKPFIHLHGVFSDEKNQTFGGHIEKMQVAVTLEIVLIEFTKNSVRMYDEETGLYLIEPEATPQ